MSKLTEMLISAGAPVLKSVVEQGIGGLGGKLAGIAIDALAKALGSPPTEEGVADAIDRGGPTAVEKVKTIESEFREDLSRIAEANRDVMVGYQQVLLKDASSEGWLANHWRPLFAVAFTGVFVMIAVTICRGIWIGQLQGVEAVAGLLITMLAAGCAVLGVQIWQRSEEKKAGVQ